MKNKTGLTCFECDHGIRKTDINVTCKLKKIERYAVFACICRDYQSRAAKKDLARKAFRK